MQISSGKIASCSQGGMAAVRSNKWGFKESYGKDVTEQTLLATNHLASAYGSRRCWAILSREDSQKRVNRWFLYDIE